MSKSKNKKIYGILSFVIFLLLPHLCLRNENIYEISLNVYFCKRMSGKKEEKRRFFCVCFTLLFSLNRMFAYFLILFDFYFFIYEKIFFNEFYGLSFIMHDFELVDYFCATLKIYIALKKL